MKKFLSLLTLLLCAVVSVSAQTTLFSADAIATSNQSFSTGTAEITSAQATITGGKMYAINEQSEAKNLIGKQGSSYMFSMTNNNTYFKVELTKALAVGDVISAKTYSRTDAALGVFVSTAISRPNECTTKLSISTVTTAAYEPLSDYTVQNGDGLVGATTIYLYRETGKTTYFDEFIITRPSTKVITSKVLTGVKINGTSWDISGLSENAATIATGYAGPPTAQFIYTINYDDSSSDTDKTENVEAVKSGANYVATSTVLTTNVSLTFTNVSNVLFSMTDPTGPTDDVAAQTKSDVTATFSPGGSAVVYNGHGSSAAKMIYNDKVNLNGSSNSYYQANFTAKLAEGDVITCSNTTAGTFKMSNTTSGGSVVNFPYTIPSGSGFIGKKTIYVFKSGSGDPSFDSFTITRYEKHHVTYALGEGTGTAPTESDKPETGTFTVKDGSGITAPSGKMFKCWNDGTADYYSGATYTMGTTDVTLTAVYTTIITASFDNGGHGTAPDAQTSSTITLSSIKADWYENETWVADQDVTVDDATVTAGTAIAVGKIARISTNTTFTAQWTYTGSPYIEGVTLPQPAANALDLESQTVLDVTNGYVVVNPNDVRGNSTTGYWFTSANANKSGFSWTAPEGSVFSAGSSVNCVTLQTQRTYAAKFTGTTEFQALMNSRKDGSSNKVKALLVDYSGSNPARVGSIKEVGNLGNSGTAALTNAAIVTFSNLDPTHTYAVFFYGFDASTNGVLYQVAFKPIVTAEVNSTYGWATFCSDKALDFTGITDVKAYIVTDHNKKAIEKTQVTGAVKANTPLLLEGVTTVIPVATTTGEDYSGTNKLQPGNGTTDGVAWESGKTKYVLSVNTSTDKAEFQKIVDGTPATVPTGKAYLQFDEEITDAPFLSLFFEDEMVTGVNDVRSKMAEVNGEVYNLNGQRVSKPAKGLYIVNGKKVVIK